jgi:hypothetical protein
MADNCRDAHKAFIIMPISVPEHCLSLYAHSGSKDHFRRVLDALLIPAVEAIGYEPIAPSFKGSVHIQAEIVQALSAADLVLCDMSALNPNVFYELGARSALNLPVALIVDEHHREMVPFDLRPIGYCQYESSLHAWEKDAQVHAIAEHMRDTLAKGSQNALWKYFGVSATAEFDPNATTQEDKLDVIMRTVTNLAAGSQSQSYELPRHPGPDRPEPGRNEAETYLNWLLYMNGEHGGVLGNRDSVLYEAAALRLRKGCYNVVAEVTQEIVNEDGFVPIGDLAARLQEHPWFLSG